jgi:pimeloyl-ACP methyl ester carboxylesterase
MSQRLTILLAVASMSCAGTPPPHPSSAPEAAAPLVLAPCKLPDVPRPAKCGTAHVLEDRALGHGRRVALKIVVVPAAESPAAPDPFVFIVGGPGEAATDAAGMVGELKKVAQNHDFVFVDQRGMGKDSPLRCKMIEATDVGGLPNGELSETKLKCTPIPRRSSPRRSPGSTPTRST